jgi:hypothetical protein
MKKKLIRINLSKNICEKSDYGRCRISHTSGRIIPIFNLSPMGCFTW